MSTVVSRIKKSIWIVAIITVISIISVPGLRAQVASLSEYYLSILVQIFTDPDVKKHGAIVEQLISVAQPDSANDTPSNTLQGSFNTYVGNSNYSTNLQNALAQSLVKDFFGDNAPAFANDVSYQTLLGANIKNPDPREKDTPKVYPAMNYLKNASGLALQHELPDSDWEGSAANQKAYYNFYALSTAVQTFNAYVISQLLSDSAAQLSALQTSLLQQATDQKTWFAVIKSETMGAVLRQILMYESQIYVLMTQQLQTQKTMLATQAMTNTLLMVNNMGNEQILLNRAKKKQPGGM